MTKDPDSRTMSEAVELDDLTPEQCAEIENLEGPLSRGQLHPADFYKAIRALEPDHGEAEPVAWVVGEGPGSLMTRAAQWAEEKRLSGLPVQPLYTRPQPVAWPDREAVARFQERVGRWMLECFGPIIPFDRVERNDRFVEEALELAQATGYSAERAHALVDYVFDRPIGEPSQEVGGVMVTLAGLCNVHGLDFMADGLREMDRIEQPAIMAKIKAKHSAKPTGSALPSAALLSASDGAGQVEGETK